MKLIPLTRGKFAKVDDEDFEDLNKYKWHFGGKYATRRSTTDRTTIFMHRQLISVPKGMVVDHINGDGLDNTKSNLRPATPYQNWLNRKRPVSRSGHLVSQTRFRGVFSRPKRYYFNSSITYKGHSIYLGSFKYDWVAAMAYDLAAMKYFGRFARLNFGQGLLDSKSKGK